MGVRWCSSFTANPPSLASAHPCAGYHWCYISSHFHRSPKWQEGRAKMTSKVMHWTPAYYILKCVLACCGAQVLVKRLLLLLRKHTFNWAVWGQNLHSGYNRRCLCFSHCCLSSVSCLLTFATVWNEAHFQQINIFNISHCTYTVHRTYYYCYYHYWYYW